MRSVVLVIPGQLETLTGGYIYDRQMADGLRNDGWSVETIALDASFPHPTSAALEHAGQVFAGMRNGTRVLVDGLAFGAMPEIVEREASRLRMIALIHLPLGADLTVDRDVAARLAASEHRALNAAALVIVTGSATLSMLSEYGIARDKVIVIEPGIPRAPLAPRPGALPLKLLTVATLHRGKGHEILLHALATLLQYDWHLTCIGSVTRDSVTADRVRNMNRHLGLDERVTFVGELDGVSLSNHYTNAGVFVLPTLQETYGMAVAEALAHGLPVVSTTTGAIPDLLGDDAGLVVPPGDVEALADALGRVCGDAQLRTRLAEGARRARNRLPTWEQACAKMNAALERLE